MFLPQSVGHIENAKAISNMEFVVEARNKRTKKFIEVILPSMISQLRLKNSRKVLVVRVSNKDIIDDNEGQTCYIPVADGIMVVIKPQSFERMGVTLAHEMVHVKQMAKGMLKTVNGVNYWKGKCYNRRTKYLNRPWEVEAFSKQELIFRRAIE